ncbi:hypothetical protein MW887_005713 [Aspergillus wentii]|nr:hypothetical protein MW887_005713 [Aspergillus wentii]
MRRSFLLLPLAILASLVLANSNVSLNADAPPLPWIDIPAKIEGDVPPQADLLAIQRTMSLYPFVLDGKAWSQLDRIFHPDIWANYSGFIGVVQGLANVSEALSTIMAPVTSQHALTTQLIQVSPNGTTANSWTYYWANHFGTGDMVRFSEILLF